MKQSQPILTFIGQVLLQLFRSCCWRSSQKKTNEVWQHLDETNINAKAAHSILRYGDRVRPKRKYWIIKHSNWKSTTVSYRVYQESWPSYTKILNLYFFSSFTLSEPLNSPKFRARTCHISSACIYRWAFVFALAQMQVFQRALCVFQRHFVKATIPGTLCLNIAWVN